MLQIKWSVEILQGSQLKCEVLGDWRPDKSTWNNGHRY